MIFNKTGRLMRRNFWFENKKVEVVREYKYLGFLITPSLNLTSALVDLKDRGLRAYGALRANACKNQKYGIMGVTRIIWVIDGLLGIHG